MYITLCTVDELLYDTVGDWRSYDRITVANMDNPDYELLVAYHELTEAILCKSRGITAEVVDNYDLTYNGDGEPGDESDSPYHKEHQFATVVEKMLCEEMGINWAEYERFLSEFNVKVKESP